eukprot:CAMPEP_0201521008 /NCGR_PEP_ID=MMETSP0161_2-20130828/13788_1 /ASSEMBLY_ACC=CAM_ASM_000251 /TAXON_ID=180227 /ORGANISM="Neoparamoeba aestuarina, Strain SoJaBio B1-5/56/2" /LENGTH=85 /DNA_ID=CAMNT_0047919561 /DNA_START=70 /DNA_END=327 /DNA_ORIENTATION=+
MSEEGHPADKVFDQFDKEKKGTLNKKEIQGALTELATSKGQKKPNKMVFMASDKFVDTAGKDGELTKEQFRTLVDKSGVLGKKKK